MSSSSSSLCSSVCSSFQPKLDHNQHQINRPNTTRATASSSNDNNRTVSSEGDLTGDEINVETASSDESDETNDGFSGAVASEEDEEAVVVANEDDEFCQHDFSDDELLNSTNRNPKIGSD